MNQSFRHLVLIFVFFFQTQSAHANPWGIIGDAGKWNSKSQTVRDSMMRQNHFQLIMPGDNLYNGTYDQAWRPWKDNHFLFDVVAIGNHHDGYQNEIHYFEMPGEYFKKVSAKDNTTFYVLNSDNTRNVAEQLGWLDRELSFNQTKFVFIVFHHPNRNVTESGHPWTEKKNFQDGLRVLLKKYRSKITALISGHDHIASLLSFDDLPVIISGAVQSPDKDKPVNNIQDGVKVTTQAFFSGEPLWVSLSVNDATSSVTLRFFRASDDKLLYKINL